MKGHIELFPQALQVSEEGQRRSCLVKVTTASGECTEKELWFIYPAALPMPEDNDCDAYLIATLLPAMQLQADITVNGSVSLELLANLTELQLVWKKWRPELYFSVEIKVAQIREDEARVAGAIVAFSGGSDAQFSAYRHATGQAGYSTQTLLAGVLVHGFDIPLEDTKGFAGAAQLASETLEDIGLKLLTVKTNVSRVWGVNWEDYCGAALAAVLCGLKKYAGAGLIGSSDTYDQLDLPWGSHPITDPLLSSSGFKIIHDGCGFSRTEKLKVIAEWSRGIQNLRVCWVSDKHDRNCGVCEKCVRTRLNLLVAGVVNPSCFSTPLRKEHLQAITLAGEGASMEWEHIRRDMLNTTVADEWLPEVERVLKRKESAVLSFLLPSGSPRRALVKKILEKYAK